MRTGKEELRGVSAKADMKDKVERKTFSTIDFESAEADMGDKDESMGFT